MAEYIEREAVLEILRKKSPGTYRGMPCYPDEISASFREVNKLPAADVVEVVHGKWVDHMVRDWRCSVCGEKINKVRNVDGYCYEDKPHFCPNCGARMGGAEDG